MEVIKEEELEESQPMRISSEQKLGTRTARQISKEKPLSRRAQVERARSRKERTTRRKSGKQMSCLGKSSCLVLFVL